MKKHLEKLKEKPDHHKKKIAQTAAIIVTVGVVLIWILIRSLIPNATDGNTPNSSSNFIDSFNTIFSEASDDIVGIKQEFNEQASINQLIELAKREEGDLNQELPGNQSKDTDVDVVNQPGEVEPSA